MTSLSLLALGIMPKMLPIVVVTARLLLTEKFLVVVVLGSSNAKSKTRMVHATKITTTFSEDHSYSHSGRNE